MRYVFALTLTLIQYGLLQMASEPQTYDYNGNRVSYFAQVAQYDLYGNLVR